MAAEAWATWRAGLCDEPTFRRQVDLLEAAGLPTAAPGLDLDRAAAALQLDKKIAAGHLRLPIVRAIGSVEIAEGVAPEALLDALRHAVGAPD